MNKSEILKFLNTNKVCHLATVEGNKPHVYGLLLYKADESSELYDDTAVVCLQ